MDKTHSSVIDYKTFLTIMNGNSSPPQAENFDWAQHALAQLKTWYHNSQLTLQDAFKVIDRDGDTYLS
jgi:Ca2+-binding EF-hand superfamily protein